MSLKYEMEDETPDDIIAEIRGRDDLNGDPWLDNFHIEYGEYGGWDGLELLKGYGERFAAAVKRERETATKCTGLGNAAQLRAALESTEELLEHFAKPGSILADAFALHMRDNRAALSAPPRNCDVGTAREQADRYREVELKRIAHLTRCPHAGFSAFFPKALDWANMPYEAAQEGGEG